MAVALTKGQTAPSDHRSSRLKEMSWNDSQRAGSYLISEMSWNDIRRPGSYLVCGSGDLARIPQDALAPEQNSPLITIISTGETRVAKLSDNPGEPISVLRVFAADNGYYVNF
jgi:hypothetical protein